jgi:hypothetical protein
MYIIWNEYACWSHYKKQNIVELNLTKFDSSKTKLTTIWTGTPLFTQLNFLDFVNEGEYAALYISGSVVNVFTISRRW